MKSHRRVRFTLLLLVLGLGVAVTALLLPPGQRVWYEWQNRSAQELIRYTLRRLEGHPKLESVLLPPLHWAQKHYEREPALVNFPTLGKGQQPEALPQRIPQAQREWLVENPQEIRRALAEATPGTRIVIKPGIYPFDANLYLGKNGEPAAPIFLSTDRPGTVWLEFKQLDGILVDKAHWAFENLNIRGACTHHTDCEHAFHVVGRGANVIIQNNRVVDFNAHIKVNGSSGNWPDRGFVSHNTLINTTTRATEKPVAPFDLVGANYWTVADNAVANFAKQDGNRVSYGMFMKGASEGGRFERNLVICSLANISQPGIRVGISFGGGETGPSYCRNQSCFAFEHRHGLANSNIVAHCNDTGIDVNRSIDIELLHNTLINTSGVTLRGHSVASAIGNLYEGILAARDRAVLSTEWNQKIYAPEWFANPDFLDLTWARTSETIPKIPRSELDFFRSPRKSGSKIGAID